MGAEGVGGFLGEQGGSAEVVEVEGGGVGGYEDGLRGGSVNEGGWVDGLGVADRGEEDFGGSLTG